MTALLFSFHATQNFAIEIHINSKWQTLEERPVFERGEYTGDDFEPLGSVMPQCFTRIQPRFFQAWKHPLRHPLKLWTAPLFNHALATVQSSCPFCPLHKNQSSFSYGRGYLLFGGSTIIPFVWKPNIWNSTLTLCKVHLLTSKVSINFGLTTIHFLLSIEC